MRVQMSNMDQDFRNKLKNYQHTPPDEIWENIEQKLDAREKSGFLFYKIAASIALLSFIASLYFYLNKTSYQYKSDNNHIFTEIIKENKKVTFYNLNDTDVSIADYHPTEEQMDGSIFLNEKEINIENGQHNKNEKIASLIPLPVSLDNKKNNLAIVIKKKPQKRSLLAEIFPEFYSKNFSQNNFNKTKVNKSWTIGGAFAPSYSYRHLTETNAIAGTNYYNNIESAVFTYSGGVNVQYKPQKRLSVQTGIYYSSMGQDMEHISVYANNIYNLLDEKYRDRYISTYNIVNSAGEISFNSSLVYFDETATARVKNLSDTKNKSSYDLSDPVFTKLNANIRQSFEYIEVPLIIRYKIIDNIIDVNLIGGVGANFLVGNNVYLMYENSKDVIGKTNGVNDINYSGSLGFGLEYPILNNVNIQIEPSIKYYLNPINSTSAVESHPYSVGIYTGVSYSF
jgi:hypothetical protein